MDVAENITDYTLVSLLLTACLCAGAGIVWLASIPGARAHQLNHPSARTIALLGWLSIVFWPLWLVAMRWATRRRVEQAEPSIRVPTARLHARTTLGASEH